MTKHLGSWSIVLLLAVAWMALPHSIAGDAANPEITDAVGDSELNGVPACAGEDWCDLAGAVADITVAWIEESDDTLRFVVQVTSQEAAKVYGPHWFDAHFTIGETSYIAGIHIDTSDTAPAPAGGSAAVTPTGVATEARIGEGQYEFDVPRSDIGTPLAGTTLEGLYVESALDAGGLGEALFTDRAPDTDGVSYAFTAGPEGSEGNATGDASGNVTGNATGDPTGNGTDDATGNGNGGSNASDAGSDDASSETDGQDDGNGEENTDNAAHNETLDNSDDKESPTIGLVPVAAVLLVAWMRRR